MNKAIFIAPIIAVLLGAIPTALADTPNGNSPAIIQSNQTCNQYCVNGYNAGGNADVSVNNNCPVLNNSSSGANDYCLGYANAQLVHAISIINTTQTGAQAATNQAYLRGYNDGSGNATAFDIQHNTAQPFIGKDFGDLSDLSGIPIVGGMIASDSKITNILHNEQGVFLPWSFICNKGQAFILQSCSGLVNSDGSLTKAGDTAVGCIRNGIAAVVGAKQNNIPLDLVKSVLNFAAPLTGCGGIVNLDTIQNEPQFQSILNAITQ
jgi:hypothetical protein